jgi:methionine synthase II (cobalamin-independent)
MTAIPIVRGAHLVGSINQPTAEATFRTVGGHLGADLARIPDGEVGERFHWILFQGAAFDATPGLARLPIDPIVRAGFDVRPLALDGTVEPSDLIIGALGYARAAIDSFTTFSRLRSEGVIAPHTRFQVSLPSALAPVTSYITQADRAAVYPAYEAALHREVAAIVAAIPGEDLAIQIDLAIEFAIIEGVSLGGGPVPPWFTDDHERASVIDGCVRLVTPLADSIPPAVQLGFHLCYGDVAEKHFIEPADTGALTAMANSLTASVTRHIDWVHLPVPIERHDAGYFAPLTELSIREGTQLYLGLVHHEDGVAGALSRIAAARPALVEAGIGEFGIGTECGFGRGPADRTTSLLDLHAAILAASRASAESQAS